MNLFRYFRRLRGDKKRALKQALLSAAAGIVIYYYLLRFHLNGPWSLWWVRDIYKFNGRLFIRAIPARIFDALWPGMGLTQMVLPGAVLGLGFWLIYRLTKQPTLRL